MLEDEILRFAQNDRKPLLSFREGTTKNHFNYQLSITIDQRR